MYLGSDELFEPCLVFWGHDDDIDLNPVLLNPLNLGQVNHDVRIVVREPEANFDIVPRLQLFWVDDVRLG